jgi:hypothetical protein
MTKARVNADNVTADIAGVTAGTGITGGGTSGTVTITNDMATTIDAAGDLIYGTANDAYAALSLGTAGKVLKVNSGATAPEWAVDPTTDIVTTAGDLIYGTGADAVARLGIGTAGQLLKVNSGATAPEWGAAPESGSMTLISTTNLNGSASVVLSSIPSTYLNLYIEIYDARWNTADNDLKITTNSMGTDVNQAGVLDAAFSNNTNQTRWNLTNTSASRLNGFFAAMNIFGYNNQTNLAYWQVGYHGNSNYRSAIFAGTKFGSNITSITLTTASNYTFNNGTIKLYGVK